MKINYILFSFSILLFLASCSKDENGLIAPPASNEAEDIPLDANMVTSNFEMEGATVVSGAPPAANGNLNVEFSTDEQTAFLRTGFNIEFNTSETLAGAYIQLVNEDGSPANNYFDIASEGFTVGLTSPDEEKGKILRAKNGTDNTVIDVNFDTGMTAGTFCFVLCFYDESGNISEPQEVCVEVESWGGFDALVGDWTLSKYVDDGVETIAGVNDCGELEEYDCTAEGTFMAAGVWGCLKEEMRFLMHADGAFQYWFDEENTYLQDEASYQACDAIYSEPVAIKSYFEGKWAYDEEEQTMTMVLFNGAYAGVDQDYGDGELGYTGVTTVTNNDLTINVQYEDLFSDSTIEQVYYFSK